MSRILAFVAVALVGLTTAPLGVAPTSGAPTFSSSLVSPHQTTGEPSIAMDPVTPSTVYYTAPGVGVWVSHDGGSTWAVGDQTVDTQGDASAAVDLDGVVYLSGLLSSSATLSSTVPVQVSTDGGASFIRQQDLVPDAGAGVSCDRQWTAARGHGEAVTSVRCGNTGEVWRTTDHGQTWTGPFTISSDVLQMGPLTYAPDGSLYTCFEDGNLALSVARSGDGGLTWTSHPAYASYSPVGFCVVGVDAANVAYTVFDQGADPIGLGLTNLKVGVYVTYSSNQGASWSPIRLVSDGQRTAMFPWIAAGAAGKVDIAYYSMNGPAGVNVAGDPNTGTPVTTWDVVLAQSLVANSPTSSWQRTVAVADFHDGSICTTGLACVGPQNLGFGNVPTPFDRRVLDFFEMRVDPVTGNALIAYPKDRPVTGVVSGGVLGDAVLSWIDLRTAVQTGGTTVA
jgi:hypothetical protein